LTSPFELFKSVAWNAYHIYTSFFSFSFSSPFFRSHYFSRALVIALLRHSPFILDPFSMEKKKYDIDITIVPEDSSQSYKMGTLVDQHDMRRVGKNQELRVRDWSVKHRIPRLT
jgi:hypothetical protein